MMLPTYEHVCLAAARIKGQAHRTPVMTSRMLDETSGAQFFFKCENLQRTGAFKFRGAYNALSKLSPAQRAAGVVAFSSGNHGQAVTLAARLLGVQATVVMPRDAPAMKLEATRSYGANIVLYDRFLEDREKISQALVVEQGCTLIPPFDHPDVIAGQGTAVKELLDEVGPLDAIFVPLGGGGLLAGSALSARALAPKCQLYGAEPVAGDDGRRSFQSGAIVHIEPPQTIADGARTQQLGQHTFPIIRREVTDVLTVTDEKLVDCMRYFAERMKLLVEPTGCLGLAAARQIQAQLRGRRVGVVISGGNIDLQRFGALLET